MHENMRPTFIDLPLANKVRELWGAVHRYRKPAIGFFLAVTTFTTVVTLLMPKVYRSEAKLLVRLGRENSTLDPTVLANSDTVLTIPQPRENEINSVVEMLHSRALLEKVADQLTPETVLGRRARGVGEPASPLLIDAAARTIDKGLVVSPVRRTNMIDVGYDATNPEIAQKVIASLINSYLAEHLRLNRPAGAEAFLSEETARVRSQLTTAEEKLRDLKNQTGLASPDSQRDRIVEQMGSLEDELHQVDANLAASRAKVQKLNQLLNELPKMEMVNQTTGFSNEGTDNIRGQFYALQLREQSLAAKLTDAHPLLQEVRRQVAEAREIVKREEADRTQITTVPNRIRSSMEQGIAAERPQIASLEARETALQNQLADTRHRLEMLNTDGLRVATLTRDVQLLEANYRRFATNLDQARIDQSLENQRISNITIAQAPTFELRPIRPQRTWNILLGMMVGVFGGLGLAFSLDYVERSRKCITENDDRRLAQFVMPAIDPVPMSTGGNSLKTNH